ncbi:hypothetical protein [Roseimaritima ulvae]|uniref:HEAT repeat protein n=1 Tax=Roseimaritima ulvae TaxID=980254 RepID=A0A5B9QML0_9BACT|nr:hypothetical protein [Roseimaritima ulvae]QEG40327.1 hypothetical protein UC8_23360 [Roseimaritima ulvae]
MNGLEQTFRFLESTSNEASLDVLAPALQANQASIRARAITALVRRDEVAGYKQLIQSWQRMEIDERLLLVDSSPALELALQDSFTSSDTSQLLAAIDIVLTLELSSLVPSLLLPAESHASHAVRQAAQATVLSLAKELGQAARQDRGRPHLRRPVLRSLAASVTRFPIHQQSVLVDAMLSASCPTDSELLSLLGEGSDTRSILLRRLKTSSEAAVIALLARMIHNRRLSSEIETIIAERSDAPFRDHLLAAVGCHLTNTTRKNLRLIGLPACCQTQRVELETLPYARRVALALVYAVADKDQIRALTTLVDAMDSVHNADPVYAKGLAHALSKFPALGSPLLLRAAASHVFADGTRLDPPQRTETPVDQPQAESTASDPLHPEGIEPAALLLHRMLGRLKEESSPYVRPLRAILAALSVEAVMPHLESIRPATRRRLGDVVLQVDPEAPSTVADRLRHPVLQRRLEGIRAAAALGIVTRLSDALVRVAKTDHLEARVQAIETLRFDSSRSSHQALVELSHGPAGSVRDAARRCLQDRETRQ